MTRSTTRLVLSTLSVASAIGAFGGTARAEENLPEEGTCDYEGSKQCRMEYECMKWDNNKCTKLGPLVWVYTKP